MCEIQFKTLLAENAAIISKVCWLYARNPDDFSDLQQEVMINIWKGLPNFNQKSSVSTWIYRISINTCISEFRRNRRHRQNVPIDVIPDDFCMENDDDGLLKSLYSMVNRLCKVDKALVLLWLDECDYNTISEIMGIPRNTVASRLHRIKEKLKKLNKEF